MLSRIKSGWMLSGTAIVALTRNRPLQFDYEVQCNARWETRRVEIVEGSHGRTLSLRVDTGQRWWVGRKELSDLRGCLDVDLFFSPSTNTLPLRRLQPLRGGSAEVVAVWISSPEFEIKLLKQRYTRLSQNRYQYESATGFGTEITVDGQGLVVKYPPGWARVATGV
jgi:hypothetical protein